MIEQASAKGQGSFDIGAFFSDGKVCFRVWAPKARDVTVRILTGAEDRFVPLSGGPDGYFTSPADAVSAGDRYFYILDGVHQFPDPASRFQPEGIHGPSGVVDPEAFEWHDAGWKGVPLQDFIIYEFHTGTFTLEGTFHAVIGKIDYLLELGINAIEIMPVAQFPGSRNWGYDGVYPFAPQNSYGGPDGLKSLVNVCHAHGVSVILDVVYNHLGPEGNYLEKFGHYFTDKYRTCWGSAVNFDGPHSDEVRSFFIANALHWLTEYHIDALRLDAIHGIYDFSARHFLDELSAAVHGLSKASGRNVYIIAESDLNDARIAMPRASGGYDIDAVWNDDFHHSLHALVTGENNGYYEDFGSMEHLGKAFDEGFVYSGQYSGFRKRRHGNSSKAIAAEKIIVYSQNHDQVGNRMLGDRLSQTQSSEKLKLCAGTVILSPYVPMLFMGEEYGETAGFQYFISHIDSSLIESVRKGRKEEFESFGWVGDIPDPQAESTFLNSIMHLERRESGKHKMLFEFYRKLLRLRKEVPALRNLDKAKMELALFEADRVLMLRRWHDGDEAVIISNFNENKVDISWPFRNAWSKTLDSCSDLWGGSGETAAAGLQCSGSGPSLSLAPFNFVLYRQTQGVSR